MADEHTWRRSLREIQLYRRENPDALIIPGHDQEAWDSWREYECDAVDGDGAPRTAAPPPPAPATSYAARHQPLDALADLGARGRAVFGAGDQQAGLGERAEHQVGERLDRLALDQPCVHEALHRRLDQRQAVALLDLAPRLRGRAPRARR